MKKIQGGAIIGIVVFCCIAMAVVDGVIRPEYLIKSVIKIMIFAGCPLIYYFFNRQLNLKSVLKADFKGLKTAAIWGVCIFAGIMGGYFLLNGFFDLSMITKSLTANMGVEKDNFIFVAIYISFINSFLEEFFFRGFAFLKLKEYIPKKWAYLFSSAVFAMYHVAMMIGWFGIGAFLLTMAVLIIGGLIFNYLNDKYENIYISWFVHMFANFATNGIGLILFGIV